MPAIDLRKKRRKTRRREPDEVFEAGPLAMARYGRLIVAKNMATPDGHKEIQEKIPDIHRDLEATIASNISALRTLLSPLDPLHFLKQAFGEFFVAHLGVEDEPSVTFDDHGVPARMIDYCQSLFAAMPPADNPRIHTEAEFRAAQEHVRELFRATQHYIGIRAHPKISGVDNEALSELVAKLTYCWVFVRSDRHAYFEVPHHTDLFRPLDSLLQRVLGVSADALLSGFTKILSNAQNGLGDSGAQLMEIYQKISEHPDFETLVESESGYTVDALARMSGLGSSLVEDALHSFLGVRLFEVRRTTNWPDNLIERLSYSPGEAKIFLQPEAQACWPTRVWPIFQRPFIRLEDESYCFDHVAFCDRFYRQITRILRTLDTSSAGELKDIQAATVESIAEKLIQNLLPNATIFRNAYYRAGGEFCEADLIVTYKETILFGEVSSGSITPESPAEDLKSYFESIQALLLKPLSQAWRLLTLLDTQEVDLFDSNKPDRSFGTTAIVAI
jgi:hypothetical protein